ncbi:MAG: GNAT family N-acetyltransferase [Tissierellia bacterium]|nr:GNAT family protein [Bacillota bacterium]NLL22811.1 GNAT family N-acetyltransferase [Tissierellia bacterium]
MLFSTRRFQATLAKVDDIHHIRQIESLPDNCQFVFQYSVEEHRDFMRSPGHYTLLFYLKDELLGYALIAHDKKNHSLELRRIALAVSDMGYGRELMHGIHRWAFEELNVHRLWLDAFEDNHRAIHLYESMGYVYEGTLRDTVFSQTLYRSQKVYSLLEDEYRILKELV